MADRRRACADAYVASQGTALGRAGRVQYNATATTSGSAATPSRLSTGRSSSPTSVEPSNSGFLDYAEANHTSAAKTTPKICEATRCTGLAERHPSGLGPLRKDELRFHAGTVEAAGIGLKARNTLRFAQHAHFNSRSYRAPATTFYALAGRAPGFELGRLGSNPRGAATTASLGKIGHCGC